MAKLPCDVLSITANPADDNNITDVADIAENIVWLLYVCWSNDPLKTDRGEAVVSDPVKVCVIVDE